MPGTCIVKGCKIRSSQGCGIKFRRLPWRYDLLCKQWLIRAEKSELELTEKRLSQFKNDMCSLHCSSDGEGTVLPSRNIPVHKISPETSTENTGNIPEDAAGPNSITLPQTIASSGISIDDTANIFDAAEDINPISKPQTTANYDDMIMSQQSLRTPRWTSSQIRTEKYSGALHHTKEKQSFHRSTHKKKTPCKSTYN